MKSAAATNQCSRENLQTTTDGSTADARLRRAQVLKRGDEVEPGAVSRRRLAAVGDATRVRYTEEVGGLNEIVDLARIQADDPRAGGVQRHEVLTHGDETEGPRGSHDWPVDFHRRHGVDNRELRPYGGDEVDDRVRDAVRVQDVLRPAVDGPRNGSKQILHAA